LSPREVTTPAFARIRLTVVVLTAEDARIWHALRRAQFAAVFLELRFELFPALSARHLISAAELAATVVCRQQMRARDSWAVFTR
jgi:hypothetical protein